MTTVILLNSLSGGGAEKAMKALALELTKLRSVTLIGINSSTPDEVPLTSEVYDLGRRNKSGFLPTLKYFLKFYILIRKIRPQYIIVNCALAELFSLASPLQSKLIIVEHVNPAWEGRQWLGDFVRRILSRRASLVVAVSDHLSFSNSSRRVDLVIPNAQDKRWLDTDVRNCSEFDSAHVESLAFIGRLSNPQKRPEIALEVAERCNLPITFFGTGPEQISLQSHAASRFTKAMFPGFLPNVWAQIPPSCLIVVPSLYEGDGLVVTEAILLNRPLVLSDIPEFRRFGLDEYMYFKSSDELVAKIGEHPEMHRFLAKPEIRKQIAIERNPKHLAEKWNHLLHGL